MYEKCFFLSPAYANRKKINISGTFSLQASGHCIDRTSCCIHIIYHQDILFPDISGHAERFFQVFLLCKAFSFFCDFVFKTFCTILTSVEIPV